MFDRFPRRPTKAEVAVARAILEGAKGPGAELLFAQFRDSRRVERRIRGATMRVVVPWTTEDLMIDLHKDVISDPVRVHDTLSEQPLEFEIHLARGGFFRCLEGVADRRWPRRWDVDPDELATAASGALRLPDNPPSEALAEWLGLEISDGPAVIVREPAMAAAIDALQRSEVPALSDQLRTLLEVTDGMVVADWALLGVRDLCVVEIEGRECWQIAVGAGADDDRRCLLGPDGGLFIVPAHDADMDDFEQLGTDLRNWIAGLVGGSDHDR